jgi:probable F420-dependent oxidoreductase
MMAGVVYPQTELGGDTGAVKAFAQAAEGLGYDHVVIYDHVLGAVHAGREPKLTGPYKENDPFHEPLVTYAYHAGVTKNLGLTTGVIILPQRQTALFAKQAADVDLFSDGRLRLGVGVGWNWVEYDGLEMSGHFRRRGKRQEQQIALIRKLWEQPVVDHEDSDHRIDRAGILPRPKRKIPIWLTSTTRSFRALQRRTPSINPMKRIPLDDQKARFIARGVRIPGFAWHIGVPIGEPAYGASKDRVSCGRS